MDKPKRVVIAEMYVTSYRVPFYNRLRMLLQEAGIELQLLIGKPTEIEAKKNFQASLGWETPIPCNYYLNDRICWMPFGRYLHDADLVVVTQENKLIYNLWLLFGRRPARIAFWGHGRNMQAGSSQSVKERFKRWTIRKVDWWFAYTEMSAGLVAETGFPRERITVVENAADTGELVAACGRVTSAGRNQWRTALGLGSDPVGLYLGAVTKMKRVDFLLDAAHRIRERIPGFQLVVAGMGSEQGKIQEAARAHPWIHYVGHLAGDDKAVALVSSDILLNPGAVGLGVLDSFASGTPYFTTDCGTHGPEIAYLKSGQNGMITADDMPAYADTVIGVLSDPDRLAALRSGAAASASYYSVEKMADRFCAGIVSCLSKKASDGQLNPVKAF